jgi:hypothetical protein
MRWGVLRTPRQTREVKQFFASPVSPSLDH